MKKIIKLVMFVVALVVSFIKFLVLIKTNLWYLIPFLGTGIGLWYTFSIFFFLVKNVDKLIKLEGVLINLAYYFKKKGFDQDDPRVKEFMRIFSMKHEDFKRNLEL